MNNHLQNDLKAELEEMQSKNLLWNPRTLEGPSGARAMIEGKEMVVLCSNNYLGLSNSRILKKAAIAAIKKYGAGSGSVRPIAGRRNYGLRRGDILWGSEG